MAVVLKLLLAFAALLGRSVLSGKRADRPNIVLLFADDVRAHNICVRKTLRVMMCLQAL